MEIEKEFLDNIANDYGISKNMVGRIDRIISDVLTDYDIELMSEEYLDLLEYCCMNVSSSKLYSMSSYRKQSVREAVFTTIMLFSIENNWDVEILPTVKQRKRV